VGSRGRRYVQRVRYAWDPVKKAGRTIVLEHLGPIDLIRNTRPELAPEIDLVLSRVRHPKQEDSPKSSGGSRTRYTTSSIKWVPSEEFLDDVLALLRSAGGKADRSSLKELAEESDLESQTARWPVGVCVGMALTVLHRQGKIAREGRGSPRNPFVYSVTPLTLDGGHETS
jgi:hypothetical protein